MTRFQTISRAVLDTLENASPYALPEEQLLLEINGAVRPPVEQAAFDEVILSLNSQKAIVKVPDGLDKNLVKWTITEIGKVLRVQ